jgi:hypothetical protein
MGIASLIIGILAAIMACVGLTPFLNLLNCLTMPLALLGGVFGLADIASYKYPGQGKAAGVIGLLLCILAFLTALVRFIIGLIFGAGII